MFPILERRNGWARLQVPGPAGATPTGWVRTVELTVGNTPYRILVEISARRATLLDHGHPVATSGAAVGTPATPTPAGTYFVTDLLQPPDPNTVYGAYAYGLSGFAAQGPQGEGQLGLHGTNDPATLGQAVSAGCVRVDDAFLRRVVDVLPLGAPVTIRP